MGIFDKPNVFADKPSVFADKPPATPMPEEKPRATPMAQPGPESLPPFMKPPPIHPAMPRPQNPNLMPGHSAVSPRYGPQGGMAPPGVDPVNRQEMKMRTPNGGMPEPAYKTRGPMQGPSPELTHMDAPMASPGPRYALDNRDDVEFDEG